jgi:hypothetical protein
MDAEVIRVGILDMQVCVPGRWTDEAIRHFADRKNRCGTEAGWQIRREGDEALLGMPERNPCDERLGYVHVTLDA